MHDLEAALRAYAAAPSDQTMAPLSAALHRAGQDARQRNLQPEDLVMIFKDVEASLGTNAFAPNRMEGRLRFVRLLLEAYYSK